ncbi:MAG TPA: glycogen synthase GlgA [Vicinamibacterales bacterium]|nr:glycogen synthase GlgA [Vicinamibacterales bacterium]
MAAKLLRVLMVASEAQPFSKTGGLADVTTALSQALGRLGHRVTLVTPRYRGSEAGEHRDSVRARIANRWIDADLYDASLGENARALLVDCPQLYDRAGLYAENNTDYPDNPLRFAFLSIAALEWAFRQPEPFSIVHAHDWQAGLVPVYHQRRTPTVFTIHNLAFQGAFDNGWVPALGLRWQDFTAAGFEFWNRISFLKAGVVFSDALTTVSPTYALEIQRPEFGYGFDGIMTARSSAVVGILNGIDDEAWDPSRDAFLPAPFDTTDLSGKLVAKRALLDLYGLPVDQAAMSRPVVAMVSRMTEQKGLDLVAALAPHLPSLDATFTIAGTGEPGFERMWRSLAAAHPRQFGVFIGFDEQRAHLVEAGADVFLMPSRYEPSGLNQMYSMRYGTVPVVRAVGGLADTVRPFNPENGEGTGFLFAEYDPSALWDALQQALAVYRTEPRTWRRLQTNGMKTDFSWRRSAREYVKVYRRTLTR